MLMAKDEEDRSSWGEKAESHFYLHPFYRNVVFLQQDMVNHIISNANIRKICNSSVLKESNATWRTQRSRI